MLITVASTRQERMRGLLGHPELAPGHGFLIPHCRAVHTVGMRFPLDVSYLDGSGRVLRVVTMKPGRIGLPRLRARHVLECAAGYSPRVGSRIEGYPFGALSRRQGKMFGSWRARPDPDSRSAG